MERKENLYNEQYKLLESIKDGTSMNAEEILNLSKPNIFIVFSKLEPDRDKLSEDRWTILKISEDLTELTDISDNISMVKRKRMKIIIESDE